MRYKPIVVLLVASSILMIPILSNASVVYYSGWAWVDSRYTKVGFTPEKIFIRTNDKWQNTPFSGSWGTGILMPKRLTVRLYSWSQLTNNWFVQAEKTYYNTYSSTGGVISKQFSVQVYSWYPHWWSIFTGDYRLQLEITIPKDRGLFHSNSGKTKIYVEVYYEGALYRYGTGTFDLIRMTISGSGEYWTNPSSWDEYKRYWGLSFIGTNEYQSQEYQEYQEMNNNYALYSNNVGNELVNSLIIMLIAVGVASFVVFKKR